MSSRRDDDELIDELLRLAGVSTENSGARSWLETGLAAARSIGEAAPPPTPAKHNAPLDKVARASDRLVVALEQLRSHQYAYASFWRFTAFGPVYNSEFERRGVISILMDVRNAARQGAGTPNRPTKKFPQTAYRRSGTGILREIFT